MKLFNQERFHEPMDTEEMQAWNEKKNPLHSPNQEYLYMTCIRETNSGIGSNKFYEMQANNDGTFTATYGRIDDKSSRWAPRSYIWPMSMWETKYYEKCQLHGYLLIREKKVESENNKGVHGEHDYYSPISNKSVLYIFEKLKSVAKRVVDKNYLIDAMQVDESQIVRTEKLVLKLNSAEQL